MAPKEAITYAAQGGHKPWPPAGVLNHGTQEGP